MKFFSRRTHHPLCPVEQKKRETFDVLIEKKWGTATSAPKEAVSDDLNSWEEYSDGFKKPRHIPENEDVVDHNGRLLNQQLAYNKLEVQMQVGDSVQAGRVVQRSVDPNGHLTGQYNDNPSLNSLLYKVEFNVDEEEEPINMLPYG